MTRVSSILCVLVLLTAAGVLAEEGPCPCFVFPSEEAVPWPSGQEIHLGDEVVIEADAGQEIWIRHGFGGPRTEFFAGMDEASICQYVRANWSFELYVNAVVVQPTQVVLFPTQTDWACDPWVFYWVFEFPANHFAPGSHVMQGHWLRDPDSYLEEDVCPELLEARGMTFDEIIVENWRTQFVRFEGAE